MTPPPKVYPFWCGNPSYNKIQAIRLRAMRECRNDVNRGNCDGEVCGGNDLIVKCQAMLSVHQLCDPPKQWLQCHWRPSRRGERIPIINLLSLWCCLDNLFDNIINCFWWIFFKLEGYGDCLVDEEDTSMCSHNITTVVTELGFDSEDDAGLVLIKEMWPQGLTASDPYPLTDPPSKAVAISSASTFFLIATCLTFLAP